MISYPEKFGLDESNTLCDARSDINTRILQKQDCIGSLEAFPTLKFRSISFNVAYYMAGTVSGQNEPNLAL